MLSLKSVRCRPAVAALILASLPACRVAHMPVPDELLPGARMPVSGRQGFLPGRHLRFGPFEARDMDRSWTRGRERSGDDSGRRTAEGRYRQRYSFRLHEGERAIWHVRCQTDVQAATVQPGANQTDLRRVVSLECLLTRPDSAATSWRLALDAMGERPPTGQLAGEGRRFLVEGTEALQGSPFTFGRPSGYFIQEGLRALATIEVLGDGVVRLGLGLPLVERDAIVGAAAALLLFDDLQHATDQLASDSQAPG